ncbi:serine/threonine protein kinase [Viridibacterium curvum]|uniref:Stress response kinase A n=1 Tax=Viridibacterium curvum TaxID=1101404 RepID=A0ABP9QXL3_9RHOO
MDAHDQSASTDHTASAEQPFASLTPSALLDAIDSLGLRTDGRLHALNSFENRVYQVGIEADDGSTAPMLIAKFYRPGRWSDAAIREEHRFTHQLADAEIQVAAPLAFGDETLHHVGDFRFALYPRLRGRPPELSDLDALTWMGRFIGRIHAVGARSTFRERPALSLTRFGDEPLQWLNTQDLVPPELREAWRITAERALQVARLRFADAGELRTLRIHGDCHAGNILWADDGPWFVDFDDCCSGPAVQDLWLLLSGEREAMSLQLGAVLRGYRQFHDFDLRELGLIEALRTLRLIHYAAWIGRRWHDPAFPIAFPWFGSARYWQDRILELKEQIAAMEEEPLQPADPA